MDYRTAYEQLSNALFQYEKTQGDAWVKLMLDVHRIESNLDKTLPPIKLHHSPEHEDE